MQNKIIIKKVLLKKNSYGDVLSTKSTECVMPSFMKIGKTTNNNYNKNKRDNILDARSCLLNFF
jgi:hypothetical protein